MVCTVYTGHPKLCGYTLKPQPSPWTSFLLSLFHFILLSICPSPLSSLFYSLPPPLIFLLLSTSVSHTPSLSRVNHSRDIALGQCSARQRPCGSHLLITSVWFMGGLPQSLHKPHATVPSARLTIINLDPTLPGHTYTQRGLYAWVIWKYCMLTCASVIVLQAQVCQMF